jgi:hypothetical protein
MTDEGCQLIEIPRHRLMAPFHDAARSIKSGRLCRTLASAQVNRRSAMPIGYTPPQV